MDTDETRGCKQRQEQVVISGVVNEYSNDRITVIGGKWEQTVIVDAMKRIVP